MNYQKNRIHEKFANHHLSSRVSVIACIAAQAPVIPPLDDRISATPYDTVLMFPAAEKTIETELVGENLGSVIRTSKETEVQGFFVSILQ